MQKNYLLPFGDIETEHVQPAIEQLLATSKETIRLLLESGADSWDTLVRVREETEDKLNQAWSPVSHMNAVVNSDELREAYNHCLPLFSECSTEMGQKPELFIAYTKIKTSSAFNDLTRAQRKVVTTALRDFHLSGIELAAEQTKRLAEIAKQFSELRSQ